MMIIKTVDGDRIRAEDVELIKEDGGFDGIRYYKFFNCALQREDKIRVIDVKDIQMSQ